MIGIVPVFIPHIPHSTGSSRGRRTKGGTPMFIRVIPVKVKHYLFRDSELKEYPPENICVNEIIRFYESNDSPFKTTPLTEVELIDDYMTIKGSPDEFQKNLDKLREPK